MCQRDRETERPHTYMCVCVHVSFSSFVFLCVRAFACIYLRAEKDYKTLKKQSALSLTQPYAHTSTLTRTYVYKTDIYTAYAHASHARGRKSEISHLIDTYIWLYIYIYIHIYVIYVYIVRDPGCLRVEHLFKTGIGYPKDAEVTISLSFFFRHERLLLLWETFSLLPLL